MLGKQSTTHQFNFKVLILFGRAATLPEWKSRDQILLWKVTHLEVSTPPYGNLITECSSDSPVLMSEILLNPMLKISIGNRRGK
jgi:hypothetical protein